MNCPVCSTPLRQLGHINNDNSAWVGENLWNCMECRWPEQVKTYEVVNGALRPVGQIPT